MGRWRGRKPDGLVREQVLRAGVAVVAMLVAPHACRAAFLQPEGATQLIQTSSMSGFSHAFDARGRIRRSTTFSKASLDVFAAHGLTQTVTLVGHVATDRLTTKFANDPGSNFGWNAMAGLRVPIWQGNGSIMSAQMMAGAGREAAGAGLMAEARLLAGHNLSVGGVPGFADVQLAWRRNAPGARSELRLDATLGLRPHDRFMVLMQLFSAQGFAESGQDRSLRVKAQFGLVWQAGDSWSVQASAFHTIFGLNTARETGATLGLWRRF